MKQGELYNIRVLPKVADPSFSQREHGITHTSYLEETAFFSYLQQGDTERMEQMLQAYLARGIVVGRLSEDTLRQTQYWAVCCVTLGTRYAIQGGLDEMQAFNLSDSYIMQIDRLRDPQAILAFLEQAVLELTRLVKQNAHGDCPVKIRKCLHYIDKHLHEPIRVADLAQLIDLSEDYVSRYFKKHIGKTVQEYIKYKRLEAAKAMLRGACSQKQVAYSLGFCSQTYFITCFKKAYGITPHQYAEAFGGVEA